MFKKKKKKKEKTKFKFKSTDRFLVPDARFDDLVVAKVVNCIMRRGKKTVAERILYDALDLIGTRFKDAEPLEVLQRAIANVKPEVEVRSRRVGGTTYQVPMPINPKRQLSLAVRQLLIAARGRKGKPMAEKLADELLAAYRKEGSAIQWRDNTHKMAEANKLFAHFAWR